MFLTVLEIAFSSVQHFVFAFLILLLLCITVCSILEIVVPWSWYNCQGYKDCNNGSDAAADDNDDNDDTVDLQP